MSWTKVIFGKLGKTYSGLSGKSGDDFGSGKPFITYMNVFSNGIINPTQIGLVEIKKTEKQNVVKKGDLLFTTSSETIAEVGMTSVLLYNIGEVYLNSFCFGFRPYNFDLLLPEFVPYLFRGEKVRHSISMMGQGSTRYNLRKTELLSKLELELPSKPEQTRIAQILSKADAAIAQTEALIAKYQRIKTGLMQELLTKGIDEHGNIRSEATHRFKTEKGLRVPEEWEVLTMEDFCSKITDGSHFSPIPQQEGHLIGNVKDMGEYEINIASCTKITQKDYEILKQQNCSPNKGDVLLSKDGTIGRVIYYNTDFKIVVLSSIAILRPKPKYNGLLLSWYLKSEFFKKQLLELESGSALRRIVLRDIRKLKFPFPKEPDEQEMIANKFIKISNLIQKENIKLTKLQSLKTGLMQDLLSGKVRVKIKEHANTTA